LNDDEDNRTSGVDDGLRDRRVLAALADWPHAEPPPADAEAFVSAVTEGIKARAASHDDVDLLAPPLPPEGGRENLAVTAADEARVPDPSASRAPMPPFAPLADDESVPRSGVDLKTSPVGAVPAPIAMAPATRRRSLVVAFVASATGAAALAASVLFFVTARAPHPEEGAATQVAVETPRAVPKRAPYIPAPLAASPVASAPSSVDADDEATRAQAEALAALEAKEPIERVAKSPPPSKPKVAVNDPPSGPSKTPIAATRSEPKSGGTKPVPKALPKEMMGMKGDPLVPEKEPTLAAMDTGGSSGGGAAPDGVPQKPSPGAVQGAIGNVLTAARACLGPTDGVSRATVTFASSGAVRDVQVAGGAAGTPAEACIRDALGKARVAPFVEPSYAATITVRPP